MNIKDIKQKDIKLEFYATKLYLSKLSEKYKNRGYEKVFLEEDYNYLGDIKGIIKSINEQNDTLDNITKKMTKTIQKVSSLKDLDPKIKKILVEDNIFLFAEFMNFAENIIKNEDTIIQAIDRFRKIEKEIDIKTKALTKHGFDKELEYIFRNLIDKRHKELSVIIFDMNNLKTMNESYGHQTGSEAIFKFGNLLKEEIERSGFKYILSNYFGGDEWFLTLIDVNQKKSIELVKKLFHTLKTNEYKIRDYPISMSACAGIAHFHPTKSQEASKLNPKILLQIADTLVLQAKIQKNRNKSGNAYKAINLTSIDPEEIRKITREIQTLPKKLNKNTLDKKKLVELFDIRKKQNEKIMRARTLGVKKVLRFNIDLINEIIGLKIIESISKVLSETKDMTIGKVHVLGKKASHMIINEIEKYTNELILSEEERETLINKVIKSSEYQKFSKLEIDSVYEANIFQLQKAKAVSS